MKYFAYALLAVVSLGTCHAQQYGQHDTTGSEGVILSDLQVKDYSQQALQGDSAAASKLGQFFLMARGDRSHAEYWYLIAAENGSAGAQRSYATMILQDDKNNKSRAIFWLKRASGNGDALATAELERLQR